MPEEAATRSPAWRTTCGVGRGAKSPMAFLHGWADTLVRDEFTGDDSVLKQDGRTGAGCLTHAGRKFDELITVNQRPAALQAAQRKALIYRVEREAHALTADARRICTTAGCRWTTTTSRI